MKKGKLYGVSIGPGEPELITIKAYKTIISCEYIAVPNEIKTNAVSYNIALSVIPELDKKPCLTIPMPMTKDTKLLSESHRKACETISKVLDAGNNIAFLTLGDVSIYSTYMYIHKLINDSGYETEIISGVPSFCAVSALINKELVLGSDMLHIIPSSYDINDALKYPGTKVLMKSGKQLKTVKEHLNDSNMDITMVENCGMSDEHIYYNVEDIPDNSSYYSIFIIKD